MDLSALIPDSDPVRTYSVQEEERLTRNLHDLISRIHNGAYSERPLDTTVLCEFHFDIFRSVRHHAGKSRAPGNGSERLTFGPHRSPHRDEVPEALAHVLAETAKAIKSLKNNPQDPGYEEAALRISVWTHAEIIRIHPFEDGNGRTARAFLNAILVELDLPPLVFEAPKQEYLALLNDYYNSRALDGLVDFCIRMYRLSR